MDADDFMPPLVWNEANDEIEASPDQLAFAAYEDAWVRRDETGRTSPDLLVTALQARRVPTRRYAAGTRLHTVLFTSWERGRRPKRMHGAILKYRANKVRNIPRAVVDFFRDPTPEHMRLPDGLRSAGKDSDRDDETVPFEPAATFSARIAGWYDAIDDDDRERAVPVWLDTGAHPDRTPVMVGRELAGHTAIPQWAHRQLVGATRKDKRVVVTGDLWVKLRKNGSYKVTLLAVVLPNLDSEAASH